MTVSLERRREWIAELAADRARLVAAGTMDLHAAVDALADLAQAFGIPTDDAQAIIAAPFRLQELAEAAA